ncbi:MerR family transcriptional regulator [uncultured Propionibacterium sp.]|uniref:MerR family transcriptional regulator n=1 Tax=uncultured Propionibacterium sp. TaxID=218066 RepID=UPI002930931E|nr:MerR family transcriptional regulator [uncultured Propionibacterium sp.]
MPEEDPAAARWTIGQFSRMTRLSARMLRHYDRLGLLRPGDVDPWNGYRYYSQDELGPAVMLRRLRDAGLGLDEIALALPALLSDDESIWRPALERHLERLEAEAGELGRRREQTLALLHHRKEPIMTTQTVPGTTLTIPAHTIIARRGTIATYRDEGALFGEFETQLHGVLAATGAALTGDPCGATFYEDGYVEHDVDVEVWEVVAAPVEVAAPLSCRRVPEQTVLMAEHKGSYEGISEVYTGLLHEIGERGLTITGFSFERYLVGPAHNPDPGTWRTQVCFPIEG